MIITDVDIPAWVKIAAAAKAIIHLMMVERQTAVHSRDDVVSVSPVCFGESGL